ncbi:MAG: holo-ACP synthase [Clostridia bacterium]|nr:holo-ACP synthase [Clostridia bacterium]
MGIFCGVDIIEIDRIKRSIETGNTRFRDRVFTRNEIQYCEERNVSKYSSYAARFAAKEAVSKAFGTGVGNSMGWQDIEVVNDQRGSPNVLLHGKAKELFNEMGGSDICISLSHCDSHAIAYVIIQTC